MDANMLIKEIEIQRETLKSEHWFLHGYSNHDENGEGEGDGTEPGNYDQTREFEKMLSKGEELEDEVELEMGKQNFVIDGVVIDNGNYV